MKQTDVLQKIEATQKILELLKEQAKAAKEFDRISAQIQALENGTSNEKGSSKVVGNTKPSGKRGRPKGSKNKPATADATPETAKAVKHRARNEHSLADVCMEILKNKKGLKLPEIVEAVYKSGYKTTTKGDFSNIVYQALRKLKESNEIIRDDEEMVYSLVAA